MHMILLFGAMLIAGGDQVMGERALRIRYDDLDLTSTGGRAQLRERVEAAEADFCRTESRKVTPQVLWYDNGYCVRQVHATIMEDMPRVVARAYRKGARER